MHIVNRPQTAATDTGEFITDLDGGFFEIKLSAALSKVAAAVVDKERKGAVTVTFDFEHLTGTHQVRCQHTLKFHHPTQDGKAGEEESRATVLHVGRGGALSLAQPSLLANAQSKLPV